MASQPGRSEAQQKRWLCSGDRSFRYLPPDFSELLLRCIPSFDISIVYRPHDIGPCKAETNIFSILWEEKLVQNPIKSWQNSTKLQLAILYFSTFQFEANWIR